MGEVYQAVDLDLGRRVALKFIAPELAADPEALQRFEREARSAAALSHPHIATLYAFERDGPRRFIAMELVSGPSLRDRIRVGPLPVGESLGIARDVAAALALAHRRGIVHRDVKPENLMFDEQGVVKIMDFGLARAVMASRLTMTHGSVGTPAYMAPESLRGGSGPPADVFALGLVLHEMLSGQQTFAGDNPMALMFMIANQPHPRLRELRAEIPEAAEQLVDRMLAKHEDQRPDAATVARELAALTGTSISIADRESVRRIDSAGSSAMPSGPETGRSVEVQGVSGAPRLPVPPRRGRWLILGGAAALAAVAAWMLTLGPVSAARRRQAVLLVNQGSDALKTGQLIEAQQRFATALKQDPGNGQAWFNLGAVYERKGQLDSATAMFTQVLERQPRNRSLRSQAYYELAAIDMGSEAWPSAVGHLEQSFALDSSLAATYNNYGLALIMAGRAGDALPLLERGVARFPNQAYLYKNAGLAALELNRTSEALRYCDGAVKLDLKLASARGLRARAQARSGNRAAALADWSAYRALAPDSTERDQVERELRERGVLSRQP